MNSTQLAAPNPIPLRLVPRDCQFCAVNKPHTRKGAAVTRPRLLDLFCGAGGAGMGYRRAGFDVTGVDLAPQPHYPFEFIQADALEYLAAYGSEYDAIHSSPPCQDYSVTASLHTATYPRLIAPVRELLVELGRPYVIENVEGARRDLHNWVRLCGSSFGLGVRRHRLFELSWPMLFPPPCAHHLQPEPIDVTGTGGPAPGPRHGTGGIHRKPRNLAHARQVMGIDWMTRPELAEAIPPVYTEFIGSELAVHLAERAA
jgi:DNA (cytosine-5)-methyltransferase 1